MKTHFVPRNSKEAPPSTVCRAVLLAAILIATSSFADPATPMIDIGPVDTTELVSVDGEMLAAKPALLVTHADGTRSLHEIAPEQAERRDPDPVLAPGPWRDRGQMIFTIPGMQMSTTEWVSVSLTVVMGRVEQRVYDPSVPAASQEVRVRGPSAFAELGYNTTQVGVGYSRLGFSTILYIIPIPVGVSWGVHGVALHDFDTRAQSLGAEARVSAGLLRFTAGIYRRMGEDLAQGRRYWLRAGIGLGY